MSAITLKAVLSKLKNAGRNAERHTRFGCLILNQPDLQGMSNAFAANEQRLIKENSFVACDRLHHG